MTSPPGGDALVRASSLTRRFGPVCAVEGVSFEVRRGEMFGLIGPDGAGKTTTLRMILGLLKPDSGQAVTCGLDRFGSRLAGALSGGMKQKLALVCTLVHTPQLLVLDEPTTGVDPVSRRDFWKLLARLQREGLTILLTTPYLDEAERCTRVALVDHGRLLTVDAPDRLREGEPGVMIEIVAEPRRGALEALRRVPGVAEAEVFGERLHATLPAAAPDRAEAEATRLGAQLRDAGLLVHSARPTTPSLEDVFIGRIRARAAAVEVNP